MDAAFWENRYRESVKIWSGEPNPQLIAEAAGLELGKALDAGCGEGADAIWLAGKGWRVTAVDFAQAALDKGEAEAQRHGVGELISWVCEDLTAWQPPREYTFVSAQFFHLEAPLRDAVFRHLAAAVVAGGSMLVVGHSRQDFTRRIGHEDHGALLFDPAEIEPLFDPTGWDVIVSETRDRVVEDSEGNPVTTTDTVVRAVRRG